MKTRLFALLVCFSLFAGAKGFGATARDLLTSPSQSIRDVGAQMLRGAFVPPPRTNWDALVGRLKPGMKESTVAGVFRPFNAVSADSKGRTNEFVRTYRMDDVWVIYCSFTNFVQGKSEGQLSGAKLQDAVIQISVDPPANYTGNWVTYWANGQASYAVHYQNGQLEGQANYFYSNGSKLIVMSYYNGKRNGEVTAFYPRGKIQYKGQYKADKEVGKWIYYTEDGSVKSRMDYDVKGK